MHQDDMRFCVQTIRALSRRSRATRAQVGCVIWHVPSRRIISLGYNGTPEGSSNIMEVDGKTLPEVIHAEMNALNKLSWWERFWLLRHCILFVTHTPCVACSHHILSTNIPEVYYLDNYGHHIESVKLFRNAGRKLVRLLEL